ncbi:hypothetical protein [Streptomyces hirsutus]|uniref:hypothetical protein n=1 Tax=Streptomyces hirsutus TaxID=35620 RepID=UPI003689C2E3
MAAVPAGTAGFSPATAPAASAAPYGRDGSRTGGWNLNGDHLVQDHVPRPGCFQRLNPPGTRLRFPRNMQVAAEIVRPVVVMGQGA